MFPKTLVNMKSLILFVVLCICAIKGEDLHCTNPFPDKTFFAIPSSWKTMVSDCTNKLREQVQMELTASMTYLAMGSHFLQDNANRPGFAKFFLDSASEERQHAVKLLEYLLMRGELTQHSEFSNLIESPKPRATTWSSGVQAFKEALELETEVTKRIRDIIVACETNQFNYNDYHVVDWLTGEFLDEQYKGQRELAGKISTLSKMMKTHGVLGEFLYDKTMA